MKKIIAMLLVLVMVAAFAACAETSENTSSVAESSAAASTAESSAAASTAESSAVESSEVESSEASTDDVKVLSYEEYLAAELDTVVTVETYVQANQSWWDNKITLYCQSEEGGIFLYEAACSEELAAKLVPGTKIRATGTKIAFSGEVEISGAAIEIIEGDSFIATATDLTDKLGTDELINHMNKLALFKGLTVKTISYKNDEPGDDIYVTLTYGDNDYEFCVEVYLTGVESDVYKTVGELKVGDIVDVEGFLYWYEGANPHITKITVLGDDIG